MRSKYVLASTIAAGSLAVTGIGVGTSVAASSANGPHTMTFTSKTLAGHEVAKHTFVQSDKDVANGKVIGSDVVRLIFGKNHIAKARVAAAFAGGFIYAKFNVNEQNTISAGKVTGGTGKFAGATGTITGEGKGKHAEKVTITFK